MALSNENMFEFSDETVKRLKFHCLRLNMSEEKFINMLLDNLRSIPRDEDRKKNRCSYCDNTGFVLIQNISSDYSFDLTSPSSSPHPRKYDRDYCPCCNDKGRWIESQMNRMESLDIQILKELEGLKEAFEKIYRVDFDEQGKASSYSLISKSLDERKR